MKITMIALMTALLTACAATVPPQSPPALDAVFAGAVADLPEGAALAMRVRYPSSAAPWFRSSDASVSDNQTLRIASVTKVFVATADLRLVDDGRLALDDHIEPLLPRTIAAALLADGYDLNRISVRMLLAHTSGLFDYAEHPDYQARVMAEPQKIWTREEQIAFAMANGDPLAEPGAQFTYSDTGFIVLGAILETVTGQSMAEAIRSLNDFERLGLRHTWLEIAETVPPDAPPRADQRFEGVPVASIHPSADLFGGGGLVSTPVELDRFLTALLDGEILKPETLTQMTRATEQSVAAGEPYGLGLGVIQIEGIVCYGHLGFWGVMATRCPDEDISVIGFVTDTTGWPALSNLHHHALQSAGRNSPPPS